jgi:hypothetical protein
MNSTPEPLKNTSPELNSKSRVAWGSFTPTLLDWSSQLSFFHEAIRGGKIIDIDQGFLISPPF